MGSELGVWTKPSLGQRAGAVAVPVLLALLLLSPPAAAMITSLYCTSTTVTQGTEVTTHEACHASDDSWYQINAVKVGAFYRITVDMNYDASTIDETTVTQIYVFSEAHVLDGANPVDFLIYNYDTAVYDPCFSASATSDSTYSHTITTSCDQYIENTTGAMMLQVSYSVKKITQSLYQDWTYIELTYTVPPGKPVLVSPENNYQTSDNTPTFTWENGANATYHRLVIDNSPDFSDGDNIYDNANIYDNTCTIENELPPDNYWWHVAAGNGGIENWSENTWRIEIIPYVPPEWQVIENWTGTVSAPAAWQVIETWIGAVEAPVVWQVIETWTGTIQAPAEWQVIETWAGTVSAPAAWSLIESWTGTVSAPAAWQLVETWTGTVQAPVGWNLIESWTGTIQAPAAWQVIETWTGTVSALAEWQLIESWTGTVEAPAEWQVVESWAGTVQAPVGWQLIEMWNGTVQAPTEWQVVETWTGTVEAPVQWNLIETWIGTVIAPAGWQLTEMWTGTVEAPAVWRLIESWTDIVEAPVAWQLVETWTGTVEAVGTPSSSVGAISPYWQTSAPYAVTATASDPGGIVVTVTLWYRYSAEGSDWSAWTPFGADNESPWVWSFTAPEDDGYYEFYSVAKDNDNNEELAPAVADVQYGVDRVAPTITSVVINDNAGLTSSVDVTISIDASDATSGLAEMRFSLNNVEWSDWWNFTANKSYTLPTGDGLKTVYVQVKDKAGLLSTVASDSITLETVALPAPPPPVVVPPLSLIIPTPTPVPSMFSVLLAIFLVGASGLASYRALMWRIKPFVSLKSLKRLVPARPDITLARLKVPRRIKPAISLKRLKPASITPAPDLPTGPFKPIPIVTRPPAVGPRRVMPKAMAPSEILERLKRGAAPPKPGISLERLKREVFKKKKRRRS